MRIGEAMNITYKIFQTDTDSYPIRIQITDNHKDLSVGDTILCRQCGAWFTHDGSAPFHCGSCEEGWRNNAIRLAGCINPIEPEKLANVIKSIHG